MGHLDSTDEQIKQIAEEVIEHAVAYKPEQVDKPKPASKRGSLSNGLVRIHSHRDNSLDCRHRSPAHLAPLAPDRRAVMASIVRLSLYTPLPDESAKPGNPGGMLLGLMEVPR